MIIATALGEVFKGIKIPFEGSDLTVNYHYGDQKELLLWVKTKGNEQKYPLIWYVLNKFTETNGVYDVEARLVIMSHSRVEKLNDWRAENSYLNIINPLTKKVKDVLSVNPYIQVYSSDYKNKVTIKDEPNYGVQANNNETGSSTKSIVTDIVDARIMTFKMRIKTDCIILKNK